MENARLETSVRQSDVGPVLAVSGEIDVYTAPMFKQAVVGLDIGLERAPHSKRDLRLRNLADRSFETRSPLTRSSGLNTTRRLS